jgi:hypothetical protein
VFIDGKDTGLVGNFNFSADSKHVAVVGFSAAQNARGLFVDGVQIASAPQQIPYRAFSSDANHIYWMSLEARKTPSATDAFELVTFADGKAVATTDRSQAAQAILFPRGFQQSATTPPTWSVGADGALTTFAVSEDGIKKIKITPDPAMTLEKLLQAAQSNKGKAAK